MENYAYDPTVILQVINIVNKSNWIQIDDQPIESKIISPEEMVIRRDIINKAGLTEKEKLFIEYFFRGFNPKEIAKKLNVSLQFVYFLFRKTTKKILALKNSKKDEIRNYRRRYLRIIRKIENITPQMIQKCK